MRIVRLVDQWTESTAIGPVIVLVEVMEDDDTGCLSAACAVRLCTPTTCRHPRPR